MTRRRPIEGQFGFSRVVLAGPLVLVGGTTSVDPNGCVLGATPYEQTDRDPAQARCTSSSRGRGLPPRDVVQTRIYVTDISRADEVGRAHGEVFGEVRPLMTMVEVTGLIDPRMLVEIELVAYRA